MDIDKSLELPPRARRILTDIKKMFEDIGTTSACAENTLIKWVFPGQQGNYLRVRGEYTHQVGFPWSAGELPPRARRIRR